jgi:hypothetical protein
LKKKVKAIWIQIHAEKRTSPLVAYAEEEGVFDRKFGWKRIRK